MSRVSGSYALCSPSSPACKDKMKDVHPMRGVRLPLVLLSKARGLERAITARSPSGMSIQLDIPISSRCRLPSGMTAFSSYSFFLSSRGWTSRISGSYTLPRVCSTRRAVLSIDASLVCKGDEEAFDFIHSLHTLPSQARWRLFFLTHALCACSLREGRSAANASSTPSTFNYHPCWCFFCLYFHNAPLLLLPPFFSISFCLPLDFVDT